MTNLPNDFVQRRRIEPVLAEEGLPLGALCSVMRKFITQTERHLHRHCCSTALKRCRDRITQ